MEYRSNGILENWKRIFMSWRLEVRKSFGAPSPNSVLKYNPIQDRREITKPNAELRCNISNNRWEFGEPVEWLQYNPFTNQWEYPR